jgi:hypothetical protein
MKRTHLHLFVAAAALLALTACGSKEQASSGASASGSAGQHGAAEHELAKLTVDEVDARIAKNDGKTFVYDDNHDNEYASGHLPGAKHLAVENIPASAFPADKEATLIFYCASEH